ncbi:MAG: substrate-binding domain-containing protein [Planctomycetes bacterium]|nr:substrate-binding domain-containing protein [Planctomycetota bacterium]
MKKLYAGLLLAALLLSVAAGGVAGEKLKVGYIVSDMSHEWYQNICNGAIRRAADKGVDLSIADAAMNPGTQISQAENLLATGVDILVITPVDAKALAGVIADATDIGVPVVTESNVVPGAACYVGISNQEGGRKAGRWMADYAKKNNIDIKALIVGFPNYEDCRQRVAGFKEGLEESGMPYTIRQEVDCQGSKETALRVSADALTANRDVNVIFGINDNATTGGMNAYTEAGLDESKLTAIGFGFEGVVGREALLGGTPYKSALAMFPDYVGASLIDVAIMISNGEKVPDHYETATIMVTPDNFSTFYTKNADGSYTTNFAAIDALEK